MKKFAAGCVAFGVLFAAQCAGAADLSVAPLYKAPPMPPAPAYNWSGFYLGVNGGGGWGHSNWDTSADRTFELPAVWPAAPPAHNSVQQ